MDKKKSTSKNIKLILELMENHETESWFSSIIGFFYQFGISCNVDWNKALELYLLAVNSGKKEFSDQKFIPFKENGDYRTIILLLENIY